MSVVSFEVADRFVVRVIKSYTTNPARKWSNTYEVVAVVPGNVTDINGMTSIFTIFEQTLHNTFTHFERVTVSTWEADSVPYNPDAFYVAELDFNGTRDTTGELEPITTCLSVVRQPASGRLGHLFYRGVLSQGDTSAPSGITILSDPTAMSTLLGTAMSESGMENLLGTPVGSWGLVMINKTGTEGRSVQNLTIGGVTQLPVDHAWFNRTSP